jgi:hypothetical protein
MCVCCAPLSTVTLPGWIKVAKEETSCRERVGSFFSFGCVASDSTTRRCEGMDEVLDFEQNPYLLWKAAPTVFRLFAEILCTGQYIKHAYSPHRLCSASAIYCTLSRVPNVPWTGRDFTKCGKRKICACKSPMSPADRFPSHLPNLTTW